jgi:hypothetical protein
MGELGRPDREQQCELLYFDESGSVQIPQCNMAGPGSAKPAQLNHWRTDSA